VNSAFLFSEQGEFAQNFNGGKPYQGNIVLEHKPWGTGSQGYAQARIFLMPGEYETSPL
jgi:hypothetical protein